ncbi:MAG: DUF4838 domain-containing protein [Verrucomicrobia bacterium]|nr:DUF4838 domain-containing protein [Verrucomicrobiota bacterium]
MKQSLFLAVIIAVNSFASGGTVFGAQQSKTETAITIGLKTRHPAIVFAGDELAKYLGLMAGDPGAAVVVTESSPKIALGLLSDFGVKVDGVADPALDDAIYIDVRNSKGVIAGSNPRSVLFAVYRFLESCGCRWIRPGPDGDYVPSRPVNKLSVQLKDKAANRFRGNMNAGTYSIDYILSKIEWNAKVGLNTFFNEFLIPKKNYVNWYSRKYPSQKAPEPRSDAEILAYHELLNREVKRRGMFLQAGGHGFNARFLGNPEIECDHEGTIVIPDEKLEFLALVNGERLKGRSPTTSELCYSRPDVQQGLARIVADYAEKRPEVDCLHFWFDDRSNNTCECERCRDKKPSEFFVQILNGIDRELTRRGLPTRIAFLIYQDLRWAPDVERFANPDRFVLMFAPSGRIYDEPYQLPPPGLALPPYQLNKNPGTRDVREHVAFLREWQRMYRGPGFVYDYHMVWYHFYDQGYYGLMEVMAEDIRRLPQMNLHGFVSCQNQKAFYPHGFPIYAHARLLWNPQSQVDDLARDYFQGAFGPEGALALEQMKTLSDLFSPQYFYRKSRAKDLVRPGDDGIPQKLSRVAEAVQKFRPVIERNLSRGHPAHQLSWKYLSVHAGMVVPMAAALQSRAEGKSKDEANHWKAVRQYVIEHEAITENVFDFFWFQRTFPGVR